MRIDGEATVDINASTAVTVSNDLKLDSDSAVLSFGADSEITLTHSHNSGLILKNTNTGDDNPAVLVLQTGDTDIAQSDALGKIHFQAPDEGTGTDAVLVAAGIEAFSEGDFSSSNNATTLELAVGRSAAAGSDGGRLRLTSAGVLELKNQNTADDSKPILSLQAGDTDIAQGDELGSIIFKAPDEGAGTDAILTAAAIAAESEGDFSSSSNATSLVFATGASEAATTKMKVKSDGDVEISDGDLVIGTAGHGIDFSASNDGAGSVSVSNEVLSDYEEGTWTPTFSTLNDATVSTINAQDYTRVGRMVHVYLNFTMPSTSDTSAIQIGGLPFDGDNNDLVPYVQNSAIFIGKSDNFSDTTYANASGKYIRLSAWYSIL